MSYRQVRDILRSVQCYHQKFGNALDHVRCSTEEAGVQHVAMLLQRYERHWKRVLADYERHGQLSILDTWLQFVPDEEVRDLLLAVELPTDISLEELSERVTEFHGALMRLYQALARGSSTSRVCDFFERLCDLEKTVVTEQAWSARST